MDLHFDVLSTPHTHTHTHTHTRTQARYTVGKHKVGGSGGMPHPPTPRKILDYGPSEVVLDANLFHNIYIYIYICMYVQEWYMHVF